MCARSGESCHQHGIQWDTTASPELQPRWMYDAGQNRITPMTLLFISLTRNPSRSTVQSRGWRRSRSLNLSLPSRRRKCITGSRPRADSRGGDPLLWYVSVLHSSLNCAKGKILLNSRCPCLTCTVKIAQVGISEVVYSQGYNMDSDVSQCLSVSRVPINRIWIYRVQLSYKKRAYGYGNSTR